HRCGRGVALVCCFFFSSRRRHTRWPRDWSSDVCSSDLAPAGRALVRARAEPRPGMTGSPVLEVRRLTKLFDQVVAARDIDVTIATEEVVSIIGANGAGKTTFVNLVTGYTHPSGGSIRFRGQELVGLP